ncbi:MAG TPA: hypothetical protein VKZ50_08365, partial [bacterium]|nr:hypothetical protein [bacterium]
TASVAAAVGGSPLGAHPAASVAQGVGSCIEHTPPIVKYQYISDNALVSYVPKLAAMEKESAGTYAYTGNATASAVLSVPVSQDTGTAEAPTLSASA